VAHKTNTGNRHIYKYTKHLKTQFDKEKEKRALKDNQVTAVTYGTKVQSPQIQSLKYYVLYVGSSA